MTAAGLITGLVSGLIVAGWFLLPGLPWAIWWGRREGRDALDVAALTAALGLAVGSLSALVLLLTDSFSALAVLVVVGTLTLVGTAGLVLDELRRGVAALREGRPAPRLQLRPTARRRLILVGAFSVLVVAPFVAQAASALPDGLPRASTSWYYALLSIRAAADGAIPPTLLEWGIERPFKGDYLTFTAHLAAAESLDPGGLATLETYRILVLFTAALLLVAFLRRWSLPGGLLAAGIFMSGNLWITKFDSLRPESYAVAAVAGSLWALGAGWDRDDRWRFPWIILSGVLAAVAALGHVEIALVGAVLGLASLVASGDRPWRARLVASGGAGLVGVALFGATLAVVGGGLPGAGELGTAGPGEDLTWRLFGVLVEGVARPLPALPTDSAYLAASARFPWPGLDILAPTGVLVVGFVALAAFSVLRGPADPRTRRLFLFGLVLAGLLLVVSLLIFAIFPTYVPRRIGLRRLLPYAALGLSAIIAAGGLVAIRGLATLTARDLRARWLPIAAGALCLLFAAGIVGVASARTFRDRTARSRDVLAGRDAYLWLAGNTEPGARILVNGYTDGVVAALAGRPGIVDGRAPYGEDRAWVEQAIRDSRLARAFFAAPSLSLLHELGADYVVVGPSRALGLAVRYGSDHVAFAGFDGLLSVETFGPVRIYRVP
jgi:hypothetical protein